ncbi:hypothetical protein B7R21_09085 [Subtercola boreus]|uniref:UspA domain-containing protein n=1 Tax=Subtercola boreus TaxID=120213 RepID=A0A3E0VTN3_9MICO|nr:universal stress protein [Subtercola boreus]RFA12990.1 hypothetical protein B7R21_09085 [Subtercola boreus]
MDTTAPGTASAPASASAPAPGPARIVVGVDGSPSSVEALRYAGELAGRRGLALRALITWAYPISYSPFPGTFSPREDAEGRLSAAIREVFGDTPPDGYEQQVVEGSAARVLIGESATAELLVVGSRGLGGFAGLLLGSVSSQCAEHAHCPVAVFHAPRAATGHGSRTDAEPQPGERDVVVVGHDGSMNADRALQWALRAAEDLGCGVEIVRTWSIDRIPRQFSEEFGSVPSFDEVTARVQRDLVAETAVFLTSHPAVVVTHRAALSQPASELLARSAHARLLVLGSRGHGGFAGLLLGSVSTECAAHATCPVVVIPPESNAPADD